MGASLVRGQKVNFTKDYQGLSSLVINVQWGIKRNVLPLTNELELDAAAFLLDPTGKCRGDNDIVFYGNTSGRSGAVLHGGKTQTGGLVGETLKMELGKLPPDVEKLAVTLTIYEGAMRKQSFSMVEKMCVLVVDGVKGTEVCRFDLDWDFTVETAIVVCELYKKSGEWRFNAVGAGYQGGLAALCKSFGIEVNDDTSSVNPSMPQAPLSQQQPTVPPIVSAPVPPPPPRQSIPNATRAGVADEKSASRLANEPLVSGNSGVRLGANKPINLANPTNGVSLNHVGATPAPKKFNLAPPQRVESVVTPVAPHASSMGQLCFNCGAVLKQGVKFCINCGALASQQASSAAHPVPPAATRYCTNCNKELSPTSKFCTSCGKPT